LSEARIAVIGLGHALLGDDAVGVAVVAALERSYVIPDSVALVDAGSSGLDLGSYLLDREQVIFVDALVDSAPPGTVRTVGHDELLAARSTGPRLAPHEPAICDALAVVNMAGRGPREALLVGVVPGNMDVGIQLSPLVSAAVPRALDEIVRHLLRFGVELAPAP